MSAPAPSVPPNPTSPLCRCTRVHRCAAGQKTSWDFRNPLFFGEEAAHLCKQPKRYTGKFKPDNPEWSKGGCQKGAKNNRLNLLTVCLARNRTARSGVFSRTGPTLVTWVQVASPDHSPKPSLSLSLGSVALPLL